MFARHKLPVYLQAEATECGLACIGMIAAYWGREIDLPALRRRAPPSLQGTRLSDRIRIADGLDLSSRALKAELDGLREVRLPAILHWDFNHFVVLKKLGKSHAIIHDPGVGERRASLDALSRSFTGIVPELQPNASFRPERVRDTIRLGALMGAVKGLTGPVMQILLISTGLQLVMIAQPFFTQLAIDHVVPTRDLDLLQVLAIGFTAIYASGPIMDWLRTRLIIFVSIQFSEQMSSNVTRYLLSLPLGFFEKRSIGDLLTHGFATALIDAVLAAVMLVMIFYYSPILGWIALLTAVLVVVLRLAFLPAIRHLVNETLQRKGQEQSELIETMRGIASVKFAGKEDERQAIWNNRLSGCLNSMSQLQSVQANYTFAKDLVVNLSIVLLVYVGIRQVLDPDLTFTLGAFVAFVSYREMFFTRLHALLDMLVEYSMSRVHLRRLGEVLSEEAKSRP